MMRKKFGFTGEKLVVEFISTEKTSVVLHRIVALVDIPLHNVKAGDIGGYIESEWDLSHTGSAWVGEQAQVYNASFVSEDAYVGGNSVVDCSTVKGKVKVYGSAIIRLSNLSGYFHMDGKVEIESSTIELKNSEVTGEVYNPNLCNTVMKDKHIFIDDNGACQLPLSHRWKSQVDWFLKSLQIA